MTIVEFLNARLDEDEETALASISGVPERAEWFYEEWEPRRPGSGDVIAPNDRDHSGYPERITCNPEGVGVGIGDGPHIARHDPARVLREVESKRAILAQLSEVDVVMTHDVGGHNAIGRAVRHLAAVYSDHPDYRQEWKA